MDLPKDEGTPVGPKWERGRAGSVSPSMEESFLPFMLRRRDTYNPEVGPPDGGDEEDLPRALMQKEQDLQLAAELGKALLERNQELAHQMEELRQESTQKLERLQQEKHEQRRRFEARESEWETRVAELESELAQLSAELGKQQSEQRQAERERTQAARELADQNQRLVEQLSQADQYQDRLRSQIHALRENSRTGTIVSAEHLSQHQNLQAENQTLRDRRGEVEQRNKALREENGLLEGGMQSLQASLLLVQGQNEQLDLQLQQIQSELEQVKGANHQLRNQVREINDEIDLRDLTTLNQSLQSELQHMMESNSVTESLEETVSLGSMVNSPEHFRSGSDELRSLRQIHRQDKGLLKEREEQIQRLHDQAELHVVNLAALKEEVESLRQLVRAGNPDQVLQKAISDRDQVIIKKTEVEMEVTRGRIERESLSRQLICAIQQKIHLAQELEAWQEDMQIIISQQLKTQHQREVTHQRGVGRARVRGPRAQGEDGGNGPAPDSRGFFSLFKKS